MKVAEWLGPDGLELLGRLGALNDRIVERLCRAFAAGMLTERERAAARLAAKQARARIAHYHPWVSHDGYFCFLEG